VKTVLATGWYRGPRNLGRVVLDVKVSGILLLRLTVAEGETSDRRPRFQWCVYASPESDVYVRTGYSDDLASAKTYAIEAASKVLRESRDTLLLAPCQREDEVLS
jgi:hypothetical protein